MVSAPTSLLERRYGAAAVTSLRSGHGTLASAKLILGVQQLAQEARRSSAVVAMLKSEITAATVAQLRGASADFGRQLDAVLADCGHRGPGETELSNPVYSDAPHLLLRAVAGALDTTPSPPQSSPPTDLIGRRLTAAAQNAIARRERCRDAVVLTTFRLRQLLRVWGGRLVARGVLDKVEDLHYLSPDEIFFPDDSARETVARRRADRARLAALPIPVRFEQPWVPGTEPESAHTLVGTGASPGIVRGRIRRMCSPEDELASGDILLATATDTGWTPFFAVAAAVVTDIGGMMSHAAIVAREFGIPAVVGADGACATLQDGQVVEIDGTTGTITVIDDPSE